MLYLGTTENFPNIVYLTLVLCFYFYAHVTY